MPDMSVLSASNVVFSYGDKKILENVSVSFPAGSFTCLVGPNGAGKTTLLRILAGLVNPDSGNVTFNDLNVHQHQRKIPLSYLPHKPDVIFPFSVFETVAMGIRRSIMSFALDVDEKIILNAMLDADCLDFKDRLITELSAGELQRVFIAQAIISNPDVLLLDEPTQALDLCHQLDLMKRLRSWADKGKTIIAVIHDINLGAFYADRLCLLKEKSVLADGSIDKVFTEYNMKLLYNADIAIHTNNGMKYWLPI